MVQIGRKITHKVGYIDDGKPKPLYTRYHRNTIQRDLIDQGYYVDVETGEPVKPDYYITKGNYSAADLPTPSTDIEQLRADMEEFGYCVVRDALSPGQLALFRQRVDEQAAAERALNIASYVAADSNGIPTSQFLLALVNKGQCFADAVEMSERSVQQGALLERLMTEILGQEFICNSAAAAIAGPGGIPQALHCGQSMIPKPWPPWPYECFLGFPLDDFSADNGGTLVIPRSHRILTDAGTDTIPTLPPTTNVVAPAGSALIMDGRLAHGTGANFTDQLRRLIILTFHKPFIRQQEQWQLTLRKEVYDAASPKLLERLGFKAWHGGLGGYEGRGEGNMAPLRDGYLAVGELNTSSAPDKAFSASTNSDENRRVLQRMIDSDQLITR
jgi:ectoine hydroxylase-related dioxygenase (phytanoyl-CoA dioxygenase family)